MKKSALLIASAVAVLTLAPAAQAQQIVHDPNSLVQNLAQWKAQLEEMREQVQQGQQMIQQGQELYTSLNQLSNVNSIGEALNNPTLRQFLPEDSQAFGRVLDGDWEALGDIGTRASSIRQENRLYTPAEGDTQYASLERSGNLAARDIAIGESVNTAANRRLEGIEELRRALDTAPNARAVMDLQARIAAETAMIQNDNMRLQGQAMRAAAERDMLLQQSRERQIAESEARQAIYERTMRPQ